MSSPYGVVVYWPGRAAASEYVLRHVAALRATFAAGLATSRATLATAPAADFVLTIARNGVTVATLTFVAGSTLGVFAAASDFTLQPGDRLTIAAPAVPDVSAAGLAITLMGTRAEDRSLVAVLTAGATLTATLDHIYLTAELTVETSLHGRLLPSNFLAATLLACEARIGRAVLTDYETLHADLRTDSGAELVGRLTVIHDASLYR